MSADTILIIVEFQNKVNHQAGASALFPAEPHPVPYPKKPVDFYFDMIYSMDRQIEGTKGGGGK